MKRRPVFRESDVDIMKLSIDELLTTTRACRKRLDLDRPVDLPLVTECIEIALQAPTGGNTQNWHFMVVTDQDKRTTIARLYREAWSHYRQAPGSIYDLYEREAPGPGKAQFGRVIESADFLVENLHRVPVHMIPCIRGRVDKMTGSGAGAGLAAVYGSILPATWSYMLAARSRGLGTVWTTVHLMAEEQVAELLGIPFDRVSQVALIPTAYAKGTTFRPARRRPVAEVMHVDGW